MGPPPPFTDTLEATLVEPLLPSSPEAPKEQEAAVVSLISEDEHGIVPVPSADAPQHQPGKSSSSIVPSR
jgi:hypothetical protein